MAKPVLMPKQGITVEQCILTKWHKKVGERVSAGEVLFSYETDKSAFDQESEVEGEILAILYEEGAEVPVLVPICVVGEKGEDISSFTGGSAPAAPAAKAETPAPEAAPAAPAAPAAKAAVETNAKPVLMPKQGITVEQCVLTKWHKQAGEHIAVGEVLFSYETDKAAFDQESEVEGEVLALFYKEGDEVPVLVPVCAVGAKGDDVSCFAPGAAQTTPAAAEAPKKAEPAATASTAATATSAAPSTATECGGKVFASPRAKHLAEKLGVDLSGCNATGPKGRIVEKDVRFAAANPAEKKAPVREEEKPATAPATAKEEPADVRAYTEEKMSNLRKVIARNMVNSLSTMAQLTHNISFDCTNIIALRAFMKANAEKFSLPNITFNDIIIYAVSRVIKNHKALNAHLINGDTMRYFSSANIGIAVDTPKGLLVPVLFGADRMTLPEIAVNAKKLAKDAQAGTLKPDLMTGGSFTISNIGTFGIESFTPVINPPQTGILGVCTLETKVKLGANGEVVPYQAMNLSLTYDHRALDGAPASRFLKELKEYLENFSFNAIFD